MGKSQTMTAKKEQKEKSLTKQEVLSFYMNWVLEHDQQPESVYRLCKEMGIEEKDFYQFFTSVNALEKGVWNAFYDNATGMLEKDPSFEAYGNREKLLSFYFTFFELLSLNRSYVLFVTREGQAGLKEMRQLQGLRNRVKDFARGMIAEANEEKKLRINKRSPELFSEGAWLQLVLIIKFWISDESPGFEKTDVFIEKSVNTVFEIFETTPLDKVIDLGKFLWQERMTR